MSRLLAVTLIVCLFSNVLGSGKEPLPPKLSPATLESLKTTMPPKAVGPLATRTVTCLPGYFLRNNECIKEVIEPARPVCAGVLTNSTDCEIEIDQLMTCPGGFVLENGLCVRIVETGFQFYCPKGYYDDGTYCAKSIAPEIESQCAVGQLEGDRCILRERKEHTIKSACPDFTELVDGVCWKEIDTFDCSDLQNNGTTILAAPQQHMELGKKVLVSKGKTHALRSLIGKERPTLPPLPPPLPPLTLGIGKEMVAVTPPHPEEIEVVTKICKRKIQVDALAIISCPPEYIDTGDYCLKEIFNPPVQLCIKGQEKNGVCQATVKRIPKHAGCPKESWLARGKCWKKEEAPPSTLCPPGFTKLNDRCVGIVPAPLECAMGFLLDGINCIGEIVRPPIVIAIEPALLPAEKKY